MSLSDWQINLAEGLRALRGERSQQEIADLVGVARNTVARWESTNPDVHTDPKPENLRKMAEVYGLPADDFADRITSKTGISRLVQRVHEREHTYSEYDQPDGEESQKVVLVDPNKRRISCLNFDSVRFGDNGTIYADGVAIKWAVTSY